MTAAIRDHCTGKRDMPQWMKEKQDKLESEWRIRLRQAKREKDYRTAGERGKKEEEDWCFEEDDCSPEVDEGGCTEEEKHWKYTLSNFQINCSEELLAPLQKKLADFQWAKRAARHKDEYETVVLE